jgi:peptidoglycan/xylan/chitin deacetylase (PgdA/CDA1 family)
LTDNFHVLPLTPESVRIGQEVRPGDRPVVLLSFDDGYADNFEHAFPALLDHGVQATFFVTTGLLEDDPATVERFVRERACPRADIAPMTGAQMREMRAAGMHFGSHTRTHRNLAGLEPLDAARELRLSKERLEQELQAPCRMLAYPYGKPDIHFTSRATLPLLRHHGYVLGAAVLARGIRPADDPLAVPRFLATRDDVQALDAKIRGSWDIVGAWQERAPVRLQRLVSPADFSH